VLRACGMTLSTGLFSLALCAQRVRCPHALGATGALTRLLGMQALELVFYNSSAAESPITQGIKAVRGLASRSK
jgi:hypothetical protein